EAKSAPPAPSTALVMPPPTPLPSLPAQLVASPGQPLPFQPAPAAAPSQAEQSTAAAPLPAPKPAAITKPDPQKSTKPSKPAPPNVAAGKINVNTASQAELELLPRIGPAMAKPIIEYRDKNG